MNNQDCYITLTEVQDGDYIIISSNDEELQEAIDFILNREVARELANEILKIVGEVDEQN